MRKYFAVLALVIAALVVGACGGSDSDGDKAAAGGDGGLKKVRVYVLLPSVEDEAYIRQKAGMELQKGKEENAEVVIDAGTSRGSADSLIQKLQSAITQQFDAIAVNGGEVSKQLVPVLQQAVDKGIKVLAYDQDLPGLEGKATYIGWDAKMAGELVGAYWNETLPEGGDIGVIRCFAGNALQDAIANGFLGVVNDNIKVVSTIDAQCDVAKSRAAAENMVTAHPDLKGIFSDTDLGLEGAVKAMEAADMDLILTGGGAAKSILRGMIDGNVADATTTFPFETFGAQAVSESIALARGKQASKEELIDPELVTADTAEQVLDEIVAISGP